MDSGLIHDDRGSSLPERWVVPRQPDYDQSRIPTESPGYTADDTKRPSPRLEEKQSPDDLHRHRLPFGWTPFVFALVVGLVTAIVVGAVVGGGVGGALASKKNCDASQSAATTTMGGRHSSLSPSSSSSTPATSATVLTNYVPPPISNIKSLRYPCPDVDEQEYSTIRSQKFTMTCKRLFTGGDIANIFVYTLEDCIQACGAVNAFAPSTDAAGHGGTTCEHVFFETLLDENHGPQWANCYLKNINATTLEIDGNGHSVGADLVGSLYTGLDTRKE